MADQRGGVVMRREASMPEVPGLILGSEVNFDDSENCSLLVVTSVGQN